jgi:hypothetical protein
LLMLSCALVQGVCMYTCSILVLVLIFHPSSGSHVCQVRVLAGSIFDGSVEPLDVSHCPSHSLPGRGAHWIRGGPLDRSCPHRCPPRGKQRQYTCFISILKVTLLSSILSIITLIHSYLQVLMFYLPYNFLLILLDSCGMLNFHLESTAMVGI